MSDQSPNYLAIDLGASSGRVFACRANNDSLEIQPIHRFENRPINIGGTLYWNLPSLWENILEGLTLAAKQLPPESIRSVGVDSWGVDFAFLGPNNELLGLPIHYRDSHTDGILEEAYKVVPKDQIYNQTGLQILQINSLFQLFALKSQKPTTLQNANRLLMIPDLFHWLLSGVCKNEISDASTSQMIDPRSFSWHEDLINSFDLPIKIFGDIVQPGTSLGPLLPEVQRTTGLGNQVQVVAPATHDTASAVAAIPNKSTTLGSNPDWCYISSGTWSLMGVEVDKPVINEDTQRWNFTNEIGVNRSIRLLKNIAGLWLVQQCKAVWEKQGNSYSWDQIIEMAAGSKFGQYLFDPDHPSLSAPENMPEAICELIGQQDNHNPISDSDHPAILRACFDSLALRYNYVLQCLEKIIGNEISTVYIVGGGSQNTLLCQITADICRRKVLAGPAEATVIGNAMVQAYADGAVKDLSDGRALVADLMPPTCYEPAPLDADLDSHFQDAISRLF